MMVMDRNPLLLSLLTMLSSVHPAHAEVTIQSSDYGKIKGSFYPNRHEARAKVFYNIPYAEIPKGNLRFKRAQPKARPKFQSTHDASKPKRIFCTQFWYPSNTQRPEDEDCLYLNIFLPHNISHAKKDTNQGFPVLVWIHGGSHQVGGKDNFPTSGIVDAFVSKGIVAVFINYRLGPLGYLSLLDPEAPGNYGLSDQLQALKWVNRNIKDFGGNPNAVTISGESAGGSSVSLLAAMPQTEGLVTQAIIRSGSSLAPWAVRSRNTEMNSDTFARRINCSSFLSKNIQAVISCLQSKPVSQIKDAYNHIAAADLHLLLQNGNEAMNDNHPFFANNFFTPVVDSYLQNESLIPSYPRQLIRENARVPLFAGFTTLESAGQFIFYLMADRHRNVSLFQDLSAMIPAQIYRHPNQIRQAAYHLYFPPRYSNDPLTRHEKHKQFIEIMSDQNFAAPVVQEAQWYAQKGLPVFGYKYQYRKLDLEAILWRSGKLKTDAPMHGSDLVVLFKEPRLIIEKNTHLSISPTDKQVSEDMATDLSNFIVCGNPNLHHSNCQSKLRHHSHNLKQEWPSISDQSNCKSAKIYDTPSEPKGTHSFGSFWTPHQQFWIQTVPLIDVLSLEGDYKFKIPDETCETSCRNTDSTKNQSEASADLYRIPFIVTITVSLILLLSTVLLAVAMRTRVGDR